MYNYITANRSWDNERLNNLIKWSKIHDRKENIMKIMRKSCHVRKLFKDRIWWYLTYASLYILTRNWHCFKNQLKIVNNAFFEKNLSLKLDESSFCQPFTGLKKRQNSVYAVDLCKWILQSFEEKRKKKFQTENPQILSMHYAQSTLNYIADFQHNNLKFF